MQYMRSAPALLTVILCLAGCGDTDDGLSTIAAARARPTGATATVEGFVTVVPGTFQSATEEMGFAIQDETAGIYVSLPEGVTAGLGAKVSVTGTLAQMAQQTVLKAEPDAIEILAETREVEPEPLATGDVNESTEGLLVYVSGSVTREGVEDDAPYGYKFYVDDDSGEVQVYVHVVGGAPVVDLTSVTPGAWVEVTGLAAQYESTYEVVPRQPSDFTLM